jgi:hypothetical protein
MMTGAPATIRLDSIRAAMVVQPRKPAGLLGHLREVAALVREGSVKR